MTVSLRAYQPGDFSSVWDLWQAALGAQWPLTPSALSRMIAGPHFREGDHVVAEEMQQVVGFAATSVRGAGKGGIPLLMVHPSVQRQGIGTRLHKAALETLQQQNVISVNFTEGVERFWPGVPLNMDGAVPFFQSCGWSFSHTNYDLMRSLTDYQTPPGVLERAAQQGIVIRTAAPEDRDAITAFERHNFPSWAGFFDQTASQGLYADIVAAWDGDQVVGSLLISKADVRTPDPDTLWHLLLGDAMGGMGAVGVTPSYEGRGIGLAMVAVGSEILRDRGVESCLIGWTTLTEFYGKLGYAIWREYAMAISREGGILPSVQNAKV